MAILAQSYKLDLKKNLKLIPSEFCHFLKFHNSIFLPSADYEVVAEGIETTFYPPSPDFNDIGF
jgi:hypothetical protein